MNHTAAVGIGPRLVLLTEQPEMQLAVVASGLTAVAGPPAWQVLWLGATATAMVAAVRRSRSGPPESGHGDDGGGFGDGGGGGGLGPPRGPLPTSPAGFRTG